ncbi:hypothetical protein JCM10449v2_007509 [Rhodotorula kratochvilovae]
MDSSGAPRRRPSAAYVPIAPFDSHASSSTTPVFADDSPEIKAKPWTRRSSALASPVVWRSRTNGLRTTTRLRCVVLVLAPLALVVLLVVAVSHPSSPSHVEKVSHWTSSVLARKAALRSPHHTYAFAVPMPNVRGAYEEHPIHGLMREAKEQWAEKIARQSTTYDEAVSEYRRRYKREPPPGFDLWYRWARDHDVQLIDEFDPTFFHVEPYFSLKPSELRRRIRSLEDPENDGRDHAIMTIRGGRYERSGAKWRDPVPEGFEELIADFVHHLPDMVIPIYLHDASHVQVDHEAMQQYKLAARQGRWANESEMLLQGENFWTWRERTCAPDSELRREVSGLDNAFVPPGPSFVRYHSREMSYCSNPRNLYIHGATSHNVYLQGLKPSFAMSRTGPDADMLWPSTIQYNLNPKRESAFREKKGTLLWRGSPDGIAVDPDMKWRQSHRFRLLTLTNSNDSTPRPVRQTRLDPLGREYQLDVPLSLAKLNARYSNVRATGGPVQCRADLCEHLEGEMRFVPKATLEEMADNKYVMDVDGNAYSARFRAHLLSNQVPFKATIYEEHYSTRIQPWLHYVPVRVDYSDLYNILAFFDGGLDAQRSGNHDALAEEIAMAGREWAERFWRTEDMQAYLFRLLLEYGRLLDPAREREHDH